MTHPNETPQARLEAMAANEFMRSPAKHDFHTAIKAVALDLLTQLAAANARVEAAEFTIVQEREWGSRILNAATLTGWNVLEGSIPDWIKNLNARAAGRCDPDAASDLHTREPGADAGELRESDSGAGWTPEMKRAIAHEAVDDQIRDAVDA